MAKPLPGQLVGEAVRQAAKSGHQDWLDGRGRLMLKNLTYSQLERWCSATGEATVMMTSKVEPVHLYARGFGVQQVLTSVTRVPAPSSAASGMICFLYCCSVLLAGRIMP